MMMFFRVSVQLSVEPMRSAAPSTTEQLPVHFYLITVLTQLDCFDRSVHSQCALCDKTWLMLQNTF